MVCQGDIADGLDPYGDGAFDFVLLIGTFQELVQPAEILREAFRVGRRVILSFTNFGHYQVRLQVLLRGRTPTTLSLPTPWHRTRNLHSLSVADFREFRHDAAIQEERRAFFSGERSIKWLPNLCAKMAVFELRTK